MRVISGFAKGILLAAVPGDTTRPILDRVKTPLFDILSAHIEGSSILDMFAGTGALGIEALSRGAATCIFLDQSLAAVKTIKQNLEQTQLSQTTEVRNTDAFKYTRDTKKIFDLVFIDPPQNHGIWIEALKLFAERPGLLSNNAILAIKIHPAEYEKFTSTSVLEFDQRKYGESMLLFYKKL